MKKMMTITLCAVMALALAACGNNTANNESNPSQPSSAPTEAGTLPGGDSSILPGGDSATLPENDDNMQIPNPFVDCATMEEAAELAGFTLTAPEAIEGYTGMTIQVMNQSLIQLFYSNEEDADTADYSFLRIRKAAGSDDISGDYNSYAETNTVSVGDLQVTMKGNDGTVNVATWTDGDYTFALTVTNALSTDAASAIIENVK